MDKVRNNKSRVGCCLLALVRFGSVSIPSSKLSPPFPLSYRNHAEMSAGAMELDALIDCQILLNQMLPRLVDEEKGIAGSLPCF